jgi:hypothetical protein
MQAASNQHSNSHSNSATVTKLVSSLVTFCLVAVLCLVATSQPHHPWNVDRRLSAPADKFENVSNGEHVSGNISVLRPGVSSLCLCNPTATNVHLLVEQAPFLYSIRGWVSNSGPCNCISSGTLPRRAKEGQPFGCSYIRQGDYEYSPCQGQEKFYYQRNSNLVGQYLCSGSPPVCRYHGFCRQPSCSTYHPR